MASSRASAGNKHTLEFDDTYFEVDPAAGGRVTSFRLSGVDALSGPEIDPNNYGSTLWTSPQSDWGWPPPAEFDRCVYSGSVDARTLTLAGPPNAALGVRLEKRFTVDRAKAAIAIEYAIHNVSALPKFYAPWEVSRVHAGGLTFFPTGDRQAGSLPVDRRAGCTWYAHAPETLDETGRKHAADGKEGYIAHAARGLLYLRTFPDLPPERQAPGEGEVEVYANNRYVEVETQGPYVSIEPGTAARWEVTWYLRKLDDPGAVAIGSAALKEQVAGLLATERRQNAP